MNVGLCVESGDAEEKMDHKQSDFDVRAILGLGLMEMEAMAGVEGRKCGLELLMEQVERAEQNAGQAYDNR